MRPSFFTITNYQLPIAFRIIGAISVLSCHPLNFSAPTPIAKIGTA